MHTDHKPILGLLEKKLDNLPIRIQKWIIQIQVYDISFHYITGQTNVLFDALSRNPLCEQLEEDDLGGTEYTVCFILKSSPLDLKQIAEATATDSFLQSVIEAVNTSWCTPRACRLVLFYGVRDELSLKYCSHDKKSTVVLKSGLVVIPETLVQDVLLQIHSGHLGASKMKSLIHSCAYWSGFSKNIEEFLHCCPACTVYQVAVDKAPLQPVASCSHGALAHHCSNYFPSSNSCIERFHSTLKAPLKRVFMIPTMKFQVALDKVLFDIRKTPNAMTGLTSFQALFNRPMRTELTPLTGMPSPVVSEPHNVKKGICQIKE